MRRRRGTTPEPGASRRTSLDGSTHPHMNTRYDAVIIGGGVTGCATALFLAREPAFDGSILVVERDPTYEHAPSAKATGGFRQQFSTPENIRIGLFGVHFLKHLDEYLSVGGEPPDVGFRENGYLLLATEAMLPAMRENNAVQRELGADVHFRDSDELRARFPWLSTDGVAGGFLSDSNEGYIDPYSLLQAYRRKARSLGVEFVHDEAVSVQSEDARVTGVTLAREGAVACGVVVNAAGAYGAPEICASVGVGIPIESRKRFTFVFECREPIGQTPLTITEAGVAFRSEGRGFISNVSPPPERDPVTKDTAIEYELFEELIWPALAARVPAFEAIRQTGAWCCHYDYNTLDENLIIGRTPGVRELLRRGGLLRPRPAAVAGGGPGALGADHVQRVPHHRPHPVRLRAGAERRSATGGELLLSVAGNGGVAPGSTRRVRKRGRGSWERGRPARRWAAGPQELKRARPLQVR